MILVSVVGPAALQLICGPPELFGEVFLNTAGFSETLDSVVRLNVVGAFESKLSGTPGTYNFEVGMIGRDDFDPLAPQREAAIFYGLFLRGHSADDLRRDIDVPRPLLDKWLHPRRYEHGFRDSLRQMYMYRKKVLAIFDELVSKEKHRVRIH